jgi:hypothetical protein
MNLLNFSSTSRWRFNRLVDFALYDLRPSSVSRSLPHTSVPFISLGGDEELQRSILDRIHPQRLWVYPPIGVIGPSSLI